MKLAYIRVTFVSADAVALPAQTDSDSAIKSKNRRPRDSRQDAGATVYAWSASGSGWPALLSVTWSWERSPLFGTGGVWA
jgi:hypothetical protein